MPDRSASLRRIRLLVGFFIFALFISGATAIPLVWELGLLVRWFPVPPGGDASLYGDLARWLALVHEGLAETNARYPFLAYGTDWLAFGHFMLALVFVGPLRDPVRNVWVLTFGLIACAAVIPYALIFGELRGIPFGWRVIDCLFGVVGFPLLWLARRETLKLERLGTAV